MPTNYEYVQAVKSAQQVHGGDYIMFDKHPTQMFAHLKDSDGKKAAETFALAPSPDVQKGIVSRPDREDETRPLSGWPALPDKAAAKSADGRVPCAGCAKRGRRGDSRPTMVQPGRACWLCGCKN
mmetsp:Transcript_137426/g.342802  ORF Transcript_137426/g.342802 Transcript_137426/m.342802 type:complete len:125 (+) Transcript_137426:67-441(+)